MSKFFLTKLLRLLGAKLDGYKTLAGGLGMILTGLLGLAGMMFPDQPHLPHNMDLDQCLILISGGFGVLGLGGKVEKTKRALEKQNGA